MWVTVAVEAAEQIYTGSGRGAEKKAYVIDFLTEKGFKIDADSLDKLIEAPSLIFLHISALLKRTDRRRIRTAARLSPSRVAV
jgi:hypothetical protein